VVLSQAHGLYLIYFYGAITSIPIAIF